MPFKRWEVVDSMRVKGGNDDGERVVAASHSGMQDTLRHNRHNHHLVFRAVGCASLDMCKGPFICTLLE